MDRIRAKLVETRVAPSERTVRIETGDVGALVAIAQPVALIARLTNNSTAEQRLTVSVDETPVCNPRLSAGDSSRVNCTVSSWTPMRDQHTIVIDGPALEWSLEYLEVATHFGNTTGASNLVILPRGSTYGTPPSLSEIAVVSLALLGTILFVPRAELPRWARVIHRALSVIVLLALVAVVVSPWLSQFRVVLSVGTMSLWLGILCLPQVWTGCCWLCAPRGPRLTKMAKATRSAVIAFLVFWAFWMLTSRDLRELYGGNYSGFLMISHRLFEANPLLNTRDDIRQSLILLENAGYDGQFMYCMAYDPWMRAFRNDPARYRSVVDTVPYRYGRIGFSALTHLFSLGRWERYPATMMWLLLLSLAGSAYVLATMAQAKQLTPMVGALIALVPGFWQSIQGGLPEPLAAASLTAGALVANSGGWLLAGILFALSLLVRETGVVFVVVFAVAAALSGRRRDAVTFVLVALVPMIVWRTYVGWTILADWGVGGFLDHPRDLGWPFAGFADLWSVIRNGGDHGHSLGAAAMARAGVTYPLLLTGGLLVATALATAAPSAVNVAAVCYALIAVSLNYTMIWKHVGNGQRGTYELFVALALSVVAIRTYPRALRVGLVLFWCATAAYVFFGAFDAEHIRAALAPRI